MQLILSPTFLGVRNTQTSTYPDYKNVVQWLGTAYKSSIDEQYYLADQTKNGYDVRIGGSSVLVGDGSSVKINTHRTANNNTCLIIKGKFNALGRQLQGAVNDRFYFGINDTNQWGIGVNESRDLDAPFGSDADLEYHTFILYDGDLYVLPLTTDVSKDNVINVLGSNVPNVSKTNSLISSGEIFLYNVSSGSELYSKFTMLSSIIYDIENNVVTERANFTMQSSGGGSIYCRTAEVALDIEGNLTNVWQTSDEQTPYNFLNGFDLWELGGEYKRVPFNLSGDSIQTEGDVDPDGFTWSKREEPYDGITLTESENTFYQPDSEELRSIESTYLSEGVWYDTDTGESVAIDRDNLKFDLNAYGIWFTFPWVVYRTPRLLGDWNKAVDYFAPHLKIIDADGTERIDADGTYRIETD